MNPRRETARRWVDDGKSDEEIAHLIVIGYDEGPPRLEMEQHVNELRNELNEGVPGARLVPAVGGERIVTIAEVLSTHDALKAAGRHSGQKSIARALAVSESTVHRVRREAGEITWKKAER